MNWSYLGACLLLVGSAGAGMCVCRERKQRLHQMSLFAGVFEQIAVEMGYSRISLPEIFLELSEKMDGGPDGKLGETLGRIGRRMEDGRGQGVEKLWQEEIGAYLEDVRIPKPQREKILIFPRAVWYPDGQRQQAAVLAFSEEMEQAVQDARRRRREEDRVTMALGVAAGCLLAILLL